MPQTTDAPRAALLREPANQVSPGQLKLWRTTEAIEALVVALALGAIWIFVPRQWWLGPLLVVLLLLNIGLALWIPRLKFRIHRWEVTPGAVYTQTGWLATKQRIAPLSRVQTVDTRRGPLMRMFGLAAVTITTASSAGAIEIIGLDQDVATRVVAELTEITAADEGDAT
ncbi:PH domain-containing protein [Nocardioides sp. AE5]|uniref:PH domain-containing protein n=1 Tax=Nocardioides sp. AE5 TaxID=2962573 RepID=UPI002880E224|nr:PH domain-containing protein [Nocardioides sp. AE5]MDT0202147.1 PH domain-containing protein [Nocardioides sp. AE5]